MPYTTASTPIRSVTCGARMNVRLPSNRGITCASSGLYGGPTTARASSVAVSLWRGAPYGISRTANGLVLTAGAGPLYAAGDVVAPGYRAAQAATAAGHLPA